MKSLCCNALSSGQDTLRYLGSKIRWIPVALHGINKFRTTKSHATANRYVPTNSCSHKQLFRTLYNILSYLCHGGENDV